MLGVCTHFSARSPSIKGWGRRMWIWDQPGLHSKTLSQKKRLIKAKMYWQRPHCFLWKLRVRFFGVTNCNEVYASLKCGIFLLLCWVGVHCGIYKGSYNISKLAHISYTGGFSVIFTLVTFTLSIFLPHSPLPLLKQFLLISLFYFHSSILTIFTLLYPARSPSPYH
jgi:hypothetical protein